MAWALPSSSALMICILGFARCGVIMGAKPPLPLDSRDSEREALRIQPATTTDNPAIGIDFSIVNSTGHDISDGIEVYSYQQAPVSELSKRGSISRPILDCPQNHDFLWSRCSRFHGTRNWSLVCRPRQGIPPGNGLQWDECLPNEICVDGRSTVNREAQGYTESTAWCVNLENFQSLSKLLADGKSREASVQTDIRTEPGKQNSVHAVLASSDLRTPLRAQRLQIQAQTAETTGNTQAWRTLVGGDNQCSNCISVGISSVPEGTQRVKTDVEVMEGTVDGVLYVMSLPYRDGATEQVNTGVPWNDLSQQPASQPPNPPHEALISAAEYCAVDQSCKNGHCKTMHADWSSILFGALMMGSCL